MLPAVVGHRVLAMRKASLFQSSARIHSFAGAISSNLVQMKPRGENGFLDTAHKLMPEISKMCEGAWAATKGVVSCVAFHSLSPQALPGFSVPQPTSMCGFNVWHDIETVQQILPKAGQVYAKFGDHYDLSVEPHRDISEADIIDLGVLKASDRYQPVWLATVVFPTKPGLAKPWVQKFLADEGMRRQMHEQDFGMASEIITYPTDSSMLVRVVFKDFDAYTHFRSAAVQQKMAALHAETGFLDIMTGAPTGRTVFPDAHALVK